MSEDYTERQLELIEQLQKANEKVDGSLSAPKMNQLGSEFVSATTIQYHFGGSWNDAKEAAGLDTNPVGRDKEYSDEELLAEVNRVADLCGKGFTRSIFEEKSDISIQVVSSRFGGLNAAKKKAGITDEYFNTTSCLDMEKVKEYLLNDFNIKEVSNEIDISYQYLTQKVRESNMVVRSMAGKSPGGYDDDENFSILISVSNSELEKLDVDKSENIYYEKDFIGSSAFQFTFFNKKVREGVSDYMGEYPRDENIRDSEIEGSHIWLTSGGRITSSDNQYAESFSMPYDQPVIPAEEMNTGLQLSEFEDRLQEARRAKEIYSENQEGEI